MKIAIISHLYPNRRNPASGTFIRSYFLGLSKLYDTEMLVPAVWALPFTKKWTYTHSPFFTDGEAVRLPYLSFPRGRFPHLVSRTISHAVTAYLKQNKPDVAHVHWLYPDGMAVPEIRNTLGVPVVLSIHGSDWYNTQNKPKLKKLLERSLFAADKILTVGTKLKKDIQHTFPELEDRLLVTYNPVDFITFAPPESRELAVRNMKWDPGKKHLLCVANITHEKGIDVLLDAAENLQDENYVLHIIGNVPDSPYARNIVSRINRYDYVILHPPVQHDAIADYYRACDLFILPSRREGFGLSVAEAIASGKPVIATKSGGPEDIVTDDNGLLVEVDSPDQISSAIRHFLSGEKNWRPESIRSSITKKFDSERIFHDIGRIFESAIHSST